MFRKNGRAYRFLHVTFRYFLLDLRINILRKFYGMNIGEGVKISLKANLDKTNPKGVNIGDGTYVAFDAVILTHDMSRHLHASVHIGKQCFVGARSMIMPGVKVGNNCVIAAGSIVTKNVEDNSLVAGNPAKKIRDVETKNLGVIVQK